MTIFPEKGRISEMAIFAFVDFTKFLKIIKLTFFENFKQFLGSSPISICSLRGPGWFFTKNLDHPIFPSEIAWMPSYIYIYIVAVPCGLVGLQINDILTKYFEAKILSFISL